MQFPAVCGRVSVVLGQEVGRLTKLMPPAPTKPSLTSLGSVELLENAQRRARLPESTFCTQERVRDGKVILISTIASL